ncbi:MAG TPA: hypothetical protein PLN81_08355 [Bacillota bacterium]|jgi:hypothetical protein|nr:hypothetical protein [Bacillota bacterium]
MSIFSPSEVAQMKALVREIVEESHHNHPAVDDLVDLVCLGLTRANEDTWDCKRCGTELYTREDFEQMLCSRCREANELMNIADLRAIQRDIETQTAMVIRRYI